jgi:hypothetical protein
MFKKLFIFIILLLIAIFLWICCVFYANKEGAFCLGLVATGFTIWTYFIGEELIDE